MKNTIEIKSTLENHSKIDIVDALDSLLSNWKGAEVKGLAKEVKDIQTDIIERLRNDIKSNIETAV